tara:strand:+ start:28 stop:375 length:348 start_codon:yes stop_codon:yes gene_type:complete
MGNTLEANNNMTLTKEQREKIAQEAITQAENEEAGISIMIPFMKFATKVLFGNSHYVKNADKKTGLITDKTVLNLPLFVMLGNKALEQLKSDHRIEANYLGKIGFTTYDPTKKDI